MHTKDILAAELFKANLPEMAKKASEGWYHDYLSPLAAPSVQLAQDLARVNTSASRVLRARHMRGEFDASQEESEEWARSPEGLAAVRALNGMGGPKH